jgi:hypothetical protein
MLKIEEESKITSTKNFSTRKSSDALLNDITEAA